MAGSPRKRARREFAAAQGKTTSPSDFEIEVIPRGKREVKHEVNVEPVRLKKDGTPSKVKGGSRERMLELVEIRKAKAAAGDTDAMGGRPKTKFTRAEITARTLERLEPKALKVLREQIENEDLDPSDRRAAAIKILEYQRGKPTQAIKMDQTGVTTIRFETAAWIPGMEQSSSASLPTTEFLELEAGEVEEVDASREG